jgi:hypothetical protein
MYGVLQIAENSTGIPFRRRYVNSDGVRRLIIPFFRYLEPVISGSMSF